MSQPVQPDWRPQALCRWLATLFAKELSQEQVLAYQQGQGAALLATLAEFPGLAEPVLRLGNAFRGLTVIDHAKLELAADFAAMFLMDGRTSAPPYASVHASSSGHLFEAPQQRMEERLAANQQSVSSAFGEPSDHLAVMLDYLGDQFATLEDITDATADQQHRAGIQTFLNTELLNWLPEFTVQCRQIPTVTDVYPALAEVLLKFCQSLTHA